MNKRRKVIIPTHTDYRFLSDDEDDPDYEEVYTKYEYSLYAAIRYLSDNWFYFDEVVLHNIWLRDILRRDGAEAFVADLSAIRPVSDELKINMERFVEDWKDKQIGNYDIQVLPIVDPLRIGSITLDDIYQIQSHVESAVNSTLFNGVDVYHHKPNTDNLHVGEVWASYPFFDEFDIISDDRTFQNFIIRDQKIPDKEMKKFAKVLGTINECRVHERIPEELLPMVYYKGEGGFMTVAAKRGELSW